MDHYKLQVAELFVRVFLGILFLFQGYDKLFRIKVSGVIETFKFEVNKKHIPDVLLKLMVYITSIIEFAGGVLLIIGFCTNIALYALGFDLLLVCFAFTYMNPMWDLQFVFPRFILLIFLLLLPLSFRLICLDHLILYNAE